MGADGTDAGASGRAHDANARRNVLLGGAAIRRRVRTIESKPASVDGGRWPLNSL